MGAEALGWLGRQGTKAVAALVVIGIFAPWFGALVKPYVTVAVFLLLCVAFVRVDLAALRGYARRPWLPLGAVAFSMVLTPLATGLACLALGLPAEWPGLYMGLMLQSVTSPMMAAPAMAALMGLDATLVLVTMTAGTVLIPLTAPLFAAGFLGEALAVSPQALGLKLLLILGGSVVVGGLIRRWAGLEAIQRHKEPIDGFNILVLLVFVAALMENVGAQFLAHPGLTLGLTALGFAVFCALFALTTLVCWPAGPQRALALGLMAAQRNLGLMLAATGGAVPALVWLYFGLSQLPIYLSPHLAQSLVRRLAGQPGREEP